MGCENSVKKTFEVSTYIRNLGEDVVTVFNRSSENGIHPDEVGKSKEIKISRQLELVLPNGVGVGRGFVFDSFGHVSSQCDIIIYEKNIVPVFVCDDNVEYSYFPCEGVIAVGEIKSTLNNDELNSSLEKLEKIKKLVRRCPNKQSYRKLLNSFTFAGTKDQQFDPANKYFDNIFTFIFCRKNLVAVERIIDICIDKFSGNMETGVDNIYSLDKPPISKLFINGDYYSAQSASGDRKANAYASIKSTCDVFGLLISELTTFINMGRSQPFRLSDYYDVGEAYVDVAKMAKV